jgi:hypothetical protein
MTERDSKSRESSVMNSARINETLKSAVENNQLAMRRLKDNKVEDAFKMLIGTVDYLEGELDDS